MSAVVDLLAVDLEGAARARPLSPTALYVEGEAVRALARRLGAEELDPRLLGVVASDGGYVVLTGPTEALPWIDGASWLGTDPDAPRLRLSTTRAPSLRDGTVLAASTIERAIVARLDPERVLGPLAVTHGRVIPLGLARPLDRGRVLALAEGRVREGAT